jgi:hypothetical protein
MAKKSDKKEEDNLKHYTFDFNVSLLEQNNDDSDDEDNTENFYDDMEDMMDIYPEYTLEDIVCHWYNTLDETTECIFGGKNVIFKYDKEKETYNVSFDIDETDVDYFREGGPEFIFKGLIDPDDDGNYPIKIKGSIYLIMGEPKD